MLVKVKNYNHETLVEMRQWLTRNTVSAYREVNWGGECSHSTGVMLEDDVEAVLFKLRWS